MRKIYATIYIMLLCSVAMRAQSDTLNGNPSLDEILQHSKQLWDDYRSEFPPDYADTLKRDTSGFEVGDVFPHKIPDLLPPELFIPAYRLAGAQPWTFAPIVRPTYLYVPVYGFTGSIGFGSFEVSHWDKFFSTLSGYNVIDIPQMFVSQQMLIGNTLRLGWNVYLVNGIMYGAQLGVRGNNWGMGNREGLLWRPTRNVAILVWNQYFQSLTVYTPVLFPPSDGNPAAIRMPATPEVFSFGVQASFVAGEFIIGIGTSISPVPFQKRHHSEFRYK